MFAALLPNRLATARLKAPIRIAAKEVESSGSEVTNASAKEPKNVSPSPVCSASLSALRANNGPATRIAAAKTTKPKTADRNDRLKTGTRSSIRPAAAWRSRTKMVPNTYVAAMTPGPTSKRPRGQFSRALLKSSARDVRAIARLAVRTCSSAARWRRRRARKTNAAVARIAILAMLLPNRSPRARSEAPRRIAEISVTSSGKDVTAATATAPNHKAPIPVRSARTSAQTASPTPAATTRLAEAANSSQSIPHADYTGSFASKRPRFR